MSVTTLQQETDQYLDSLIEGQTVIISKTIVQDAPTVLRTLTEGQNTEDWQRLLEAAPKALTSLGLCFIAAKSEDACTIVQTTKKLPADLRTNITDCYDLGLAAFKEAEAKMYLVSKAIREIIQPLGIMDEILESIQVACDLADDQAKLTDHLESLKEQLDELKKSASDCTADSGSVVEKFEIWMDQARDVNSAFTEVQAGEIRKREKGSWKDGLKKLFRLSKGKTRSTPQDHEELQRMFATGATKHDIIEVLQFCLNNLVDIKANLEELHTFFDKLHTDIKNISEKQIPKLSKLAGGGGKPKMTNMKKIHLQALQIRVGYIFAGAKSAVYSKASRQHIMPGVRLITSLSKLTGDAAGDQVGELINYSEDTQEQIEAITGGPNVALLEAKG